MESVVKSDSIENKIDVLQAVADANKQLMDSTNAMSLFHSVFHATEEDNDQISSKSDMEKLLSSNSEHISLMYPEKTKSQVWNLFRVILYKNVRQQFVTCLVCNCVLIYKSRTGTASLLRHNCYKRMLKHIDEMQRVNFDEELNGRIEVPILKEMLHPDIDCSSPRIDIKEETTSDVDIESKVSDEHDDESANFGDDGGPDFNLDNNEAGSFINSDIAVVRNRSRNLPIEHVLEKSCLEEKIRNQDPNIMVVENKFRKSRVWSKYEMIYYRGVRQDYVQCMGCTTLLAYKRTTGSASILRHKCNLKRRLMISGDNPDIIENSIHDHKRFMTNASLFPTEAISNILSLSLPLNPTTFSSGNRPTFSVPVDRLTQIAKQQIVLVTQELNYLEIFSNDSFRRLMQIILDIGCDYGQQNIDNVLAETNLLKIILKKLHQDIQDSLKFSINSCELCCSLNFWQHENYYNMSMIGFITSEYFEIKTIYLGTESLESINTEGALQAVGKILMNYTDLPAHLISKLLFVVDDNDFELMKNGIELSRIIPCSTFQVFSSIKNTIEMHKELKNYIQIIYDVFISLKLNEEFCSTFPNISTTEVKEEILFKLQILDEFSADFQDILDFTETISEKLNSSMKFIDQSILRKVVTLLKPFQQCIERLSSDDKNQSTINEVYLWKKKLERICIRDDSDVDFIVSLKDILLKQIDLNLKISDFHSAALFLDPNFKHMKFLTITERERVIKIVEELVNKMTTPEKMKEDENTDSLNDNPSSSTTTQRKLNSSKLNEMFSEFMEDDDLSNTEDIIKREVRTYLETRLPEPLGPLEFWQRNNMNHPNLAKLARYILNIPACSMNSKLKFNERGRKYELNRHRLKSSDLASILYLNQNIVGFD